MWLRFAVVTVLALSLFTFASEVSYQIHSYNDLREWPQVLRKGAEWLKIDPHYMPQAFCRQQDRVRDPSRGCFVLSHDPPTGLWPTYNTSDDVLSFIEQPLNLPFFRGGPKYIALCFKYGSNPCDGSAASANWLGLIDDFFANATALVKRTEIPLTFILDGSGTPSGRACLQERWRPWVSTWIVGDDPVAAATDNSTTDGHDRFQINNMPAGAAAIDGYLKQMQEHGFYKFVNSTFPYLFWEPSAQQPIQQVAGTYLSGLRHKPGFRFAINIDPVQLTVYAANTTGDATNLALPYSSGPTSKAKLAWLGPSATLLLTFAPASGGPVMAALFSVGGNGTIRAAGPPERLASPAVFDSWVGVDGADLALGHTGAGEILVFNASLGVVQRASISGASSSKVCAILVAPQTIYVARLSPVNDSCGPGSGLALQAFHLELTTGQVTAVGPAACVPTNASIFSATALHCARIQANTGLCEGNSALAAVATATADNRVGIAFACGSLTSGGYIATQSSYVGPGASPAVYVFGGSADGSSPPAVMEFHAAGYCDNNEVTNKRAIPTLCSSLPHSTPGVLNYNYGTLAGWLTALGDGLGVTSCSPGVLHGVFNMGDRPSTVALPVTGGQLQAVVVHDGSDGGNAQCGGAVPHDGLVLDAWGVPRLSF